MIFYFLATQLPFRYFLKHLQIFTFNQLAQQLFKQIRQELLNIVNYFNFQFIIKKLKRFALDFVRMSCLSSVVNSESGLWEQLLTQEAIKIQETQHYLQIKKQILDQEIEINPEISLMKLPSIKMMGFKQISEVQLEQSLFSENDKITQFGEEELIDQKIQNDQQNIKEKYNNTCQFYKISEDLITMKKIKKIKHVLQHKNLRKNWKKNTNIPKFIARIFMKYFYQYVHQQAGQKVLNYHQQIIKKLKKIGFNNFTISEVALLLGNDLMHNLDSSLHILNRKILNQIIKNTIKQQVIENKYIKNHQKSYLLSLKVYALRCRSKILTQRVKIF